MITKEKEKVKKYAKARNNKKEITIETMNNKHARRWRILLYAIILIFIILALIVTYILNVFDMAIYNPYETKVIDISSKDKSWYKNENINLFQNLNKNGEKIIWPGEFETYSFIISNNSSQDIHYKFSMQDKNDKNINIKYRLKMNNTYIIGDENNWVSIDKMKLDNIYGLKDSKTIYALEWKWEDSDNDTQIAKEGLATYTVYIDIYSKLEGESLWK